MEANAVKTSTQRNTMLTVTENASYNAIKRGMVNNPTSKSATDRLIRRKEVRLRCFCFRNIQMVSVFPTTISIANNPKHRSQNVFHEFKSIAANWFFLPRCNKNTLFVKKLKKNYKNIPNDLTIFFHVTSNKAIFRFLVVMTSFLFLKKPINHVLFSLALVFFCYYCCFPCFFFLFLFDCLFVCLWSTNHSLGFQKRTSLQSEFNFKSEEKRVTFGLPQCSNFILLLCRTYKIWSNDDKKLFCHE